MSSSRLLSSRRSGSGRNPNDGVVDTRLNVSDEPFSSEQLTAAIAEADVTIQTVTDRLDAKLIEEAGSNLKLIASFGFRGRSYRYTCCQ